MDSRSYTLAEEPAIELVAEVDVLPAATAPTTKAVGGAPDPVAQDACESAGENARRVDSFGAPATEEQAEEAIATPAPPAETNQPPVVETAPGTTKDEPTQGELDGFMNMHQVDDVTARAFLGYYATPSEAMRSFLKVLKIGGW
jgi:hypothetical protein